MDNDALLMEVFLLNTCISRYEDYKTPDEFKKGMLEE
jgi:hypothetical protein